jgi:hypothetical protein
MSERTPLSPARPLSRGRFPTGPGRGARVGLFVGVPVILGILLLSNLAAASPATQPGGSTPRVLRVASVHPAATPALTLSTAASPSSICGLNTSNCGAGDAATRVQLTATAAGPTTSWPNVQIAFVIETTAYDGVYDPNDPSSIEKQQGAGYDYCGTDTPGGPLCEESNGVPFFVSNVQAITSVIQAANPHSQVSYAMVDFAPSCDLFDDYCDQVQYHVDQGQFVTANAFVNSVGSNFRGGVLGGGYVLHDEDLADNFLHTDSITALYGVIAGSGLDWSNATHHVIVWMGSGAPRDPAYPQNYCVSPSGMLEDNYNFCLASTCEPAYSFGNGMVSPTCEGWVRSQDGNPADSIAALAHNSPNCVNSIGGVCTIDVIDLWDTPTDPYSQGWPKSNLYGTAGEGPGAPKVLTDSINILLAGCDLSAATGGTWDGPSYYTCPDGQSGGLSYVPHGPITNPNVYNPTLLAAFRTLGFGPVENTLIAVGSSSPMFTYIAPPNFALAYDPQFAVSCSTGSGTFANCPVQPTIGHVLGSTVYGWNWSSNASRNLLYYGDSWRVSFNLVNTGPPYGTSPVLVCDTPTCLTDGSRPNFGMYSWAQYLLPNETLAPVRISFPVALVVVSLAGVPGGGTAPPPPPLVPPGVPVVVPTTVNNPVSIALPITTPVGSFSLQATAAGLLMAGITRLTIKNKPIAMQIAAKNGPALSKFDSAQRQGGPDTGHFE